MELMNHIEEESDAIAVGTGSITYEEWSSSGERIIQSEEDVDIIIFDSWVLIDGFASSAWIPRERVESVTFL
jgi:hypothetical protein